MPDSALCITDVARAAGVSAATVSRAFNRPDSVRPETRARVEQAARALDWRPNASARTLRTQKSRVIGVVLPTLLNPVFAECLQGIAEAAAAGGYAIVPKVSDYALATEQAAIDALIGAGVDGLLLVVADPARSAALRALKRDDIPYVLAYNRHPRQPCVSVDGGLAMAEAVERLVACGHERIAMVIGERAASDRAQMRHAGFVAAMARARLKPLPLIEVPFMDAALDRLDAALGAARRPTALVCSNDLLAIRAMRAAHRRGLAVPRELSVIGFDGIAIGNDLTPTLATLAQPNRQIGREAVEVLLRGLQAGRPLRPRDSRTLTYAWRPGESCAAAPRT